MLFGVVDRLPLETLSNRARLHKTPVTVTGIRTCTHNLSEFKDFFLRIRNLGIRNFSLFNLFSF